ncbi:hypothetical protein PYW08_010425 [Mythimna loreyi]|uniref:Uncharacterized protein n=1 Tax=Mythimna loreyi TaxID=667449 RepID=A0ACC2Q775_9NEOP|nr:hypothetical protein PYW08_010425 [Mythimna loreyi]
MFRTQCLMGLVAVCVGLVHSWDCVVSHGDVLEFYENKNKIDTVRIDSHKPTALTYDEVNDMVLYVDKKSNNDTICVYDISTKLNKCLMERKGRNIRGIAFDPVTETLFFSDTKEKSINWIPVKSGSNEYGNLVIKIDDGIPTDIAVDSCRGYVYWITTNLTPPRIERARFDGSEKEVVINISSYSINTTYTLEPHSLTIDQHTRRMYWIVPHDSGHQKIIYSNLNGTDKTYIYTLYESFNPSSNTLTAAKSAIFWFDWRMKENTDILKLGKTSWAILQRIKSNSKNVIVGITVNSRIKDLIKGNNDCKAPSFVTEKNCKEPYCVHGVKVGKSLCNCTPGYIGERCDVSVCENYCLHGNCSVNDEGIPDCRCNAGYSGERCEVAACHNYCLNNGVCTLNEEDKPSCECVAKYDGPRCEVFQTVTLTFSSYPAYPEETNDTLVNLLSNWRKPKVLVIVDED